MEKAVSLLSQDNEEETLVSAASFIQNQCLRSDDAKKIVRFCTLIYNINECLWSITWQSK